MSGVEVLGVVASAVQLVDCVLRISNTLLEISERLHEYPARLHSHVDQVKHLIQAARLAEGNPSLHTPTIHAHVKTTLAAAAELQTTLERIAVDYSQKSWAHRYLKIILRGAFEERQLVAKFVNLERQKSDLIFCISVVHSDALAEIQEGVDWLVDIISCHMESRMPSIFAKKKKLQQGENWESPQAQNGDRMALMRLEDIGIRGDRSQSSVSEPESRPATSTRMSCDIQSQGHTNAASSIKNNLITKSKGIVAILGFAKKGDYDLTGNSITDDSRGFIGAVEDKKSTRAMVKKVFKD